MIRHGWDLFRGFLVIFQLLPFKYIASSYHLIKIYVKEVNGR